MLPPKEQLTEVVRLLEEDKYVFQNDPVPITESLKASSQPLLERLISRATRIDASQKILDTIHKVNARIHMLIIFLSLGWILLGFLGLVTLMQATSVNFFYILVSLLGMHTLMLFVWLVFLIKGLLSKTKPHAWLFTPNFFIRKSDPITQAAVNLYTSQLQQHGMRWYVGKISHQLWLATLVGMLFAVIFLLMVRQYDFNWQSTLLTSDTLIHVVSVLSWLPQTLGFNVPSADDVIASQMLSQTQKPMDALLARKWASLLIASILCYGFLPRIIAWITCKVMLTKQKFALPIQHPYYQDIIRSWSVKVVDEDDSQPDVVVQAPKATINTQENIEKLACLIEAQDISSDWLTKVLDTSWQLFAHNNGMIDSRDELNELINHLQQNPSQLLIGIRAEALPDRGMMRKIEKLAQVARAGVIVKLLPKANTELDPTRLTQWHEALAERNIAMVED